MNVNHFYCISQDNTNLIRLTQQLSSDMAKLTYCCSRPLNIENFFLDEDSRDHLTAWPNSGGSGAAGGGSHSQTCCLVCWYLHDYVIYTGWKGPFLQ